jgi:chorismate dehydratase
VLRSSPISDRPASTDDSALRIGAVRYLNSRPLFESLPKLFPAAKISYDVPSQLARALATGELDLGLAPIVEWLRRPALSLLGNACIACDGPVWSVKLFFRRPPERTRVLAADAGSKTSVVLARLLLKRLAGVAPEITPLPLDSDSTATTADAVLLIGDRAMHPPTFEFNSCWDLGEQWNRWTGLPFVFAAWVGHRLPQEDDIAARLDAARDRGVADARDIAARCAGEYGLTSARCREYLTERLSYHLGPRQLAAIDRFRDEALTLKLLDIESREPVRGTLHA